MVFEMQIHQYAQARYAQYHIKIPIISDYNFKNPIFDFENHVFYKDEKQQNSSVVHKTSKLLFKSD